MAYKVIILYQLYMPSYFLGTFTEYPYIYLKSAKNIELYKYQHFIERYIHIILYPETIMLV